MIKVKIDQNYRVTDIERDTTQVMSVMTPAEIIVPDNLFHLVNQSPGGIEVIPISGQQWQAMTNNERNQLLELVESTGKPAEQYVREFESHYPKTPRGK